MLVIVTYTAIAVDEAYTWDILSVGVKLFNTEIGLYETIDGSL